MWRSIKYKSSKISGELSMNCIPRQGEIIMIEGRPYRVLKVTYNPGVYTEVSLEIKADF